MKNLSMLILLFLSLSCSVNKGKVVNVKKIRVLKIDSTMEYYVFNTASDSIENSIVIAAKERLAGCSHKWKYILLDSIKETSRIKSRSKYDLIGFDGLTIEGVKVKNAGVLTKYIDNCESFSN